MPFYSSFIYLLKITIFPTYDIILSCAVIQQEGLDCSSVLSLAESSHGYVQKYTHKFPNVFIVIIPSEIN